MNSGRCLQCLLGMSSSGKALLPIQLKTHIVRSENTCFQTSASRNNANVALSCHRTVGCNPVPSSIRSIHLCIRRLLTYGLPLQQLFSDTFCLLYPISLSYLARFPNVDHFSTLGSVKLIHPSLRYLDPRLLLSAFCFQISATWIPQFHSFPWLILPRLPNVDHFSTLYFISSIHLSRRPLLTYD